jgi:hypothetical protein
MSHDDEIDRMMHAEMQAKWVARITTMIAKHGFQMIGVFGTEDEPQPPFTYTIGLYPSHGYEIIIVGSNPRIAGWFITEIYKKLKSGEQINCDVPYTDLINVPYAFKQANEKARGYVCQADRYYNTEVPVLQLVVADEAGKLPWEEGYDIEYMGPRQIHLFD